MLIWWILFGVPLVAMLAGWVVLYSRWRFETHQGRGLIAMLVTTAPVVLANAALAYVDFVRPIPKSNYDVEVTGVFLSAGGVVAAITSAKCVQRWIPILTGLISLYMFVLYFLMASTY